MNFNNKILI